MHVVTIAGPKGGSGKSTLTAILAVRASTIKGAKVAMIDLNEDQGTLTDWWILRGRPANPFLYNSEGTLDELVAGLRADGYTHCFIDGPPYEQDLVEMSVIVANAVLIPVKLSYFDTSAIDSIIGMCQRRKKPYAFVISEYDARIAFSNPNNIGLGMLEGRGHILPTRIAYHAKHRVGQIQGKTGGELDKALAVESENVWKETGRLLLGTNPSLKALEGGRRG